MSLDNQKVILGSILKIYRERLRLSIENLAEKLSVEQSVICDWEDGYSEPNNYYKLLLSTIYSLPVGFLMNDFKENIEDSFSFRAVSGEQVFPKPYMYIFANKAEFIRDFFCMVNKELSADSEHPRLITTEFPHLNINDSNYLSSIGVIDDKAKRIIKTMSDEFIKYYNLPEGAKTNLLNTLPIQSATVVYTPVPEGYSGISFMSNDNNDFYVFVNSNDHYCKQTFTLVHEIGHIIFDEVKNEKLIEDMINYFVNITLLSPQDMEREFANFSMENFSAYLERFNTISETYEVSYKTILYSLYHLGKLGVNGNISDIVERLMFEHFNEDSAVKKMSHRYNKVIHIYLKELLLKKVIDNSYVKEMNTVAPLTA